MAVVKFTGAWTDTTPQTVLATPCRVSAIEIQPNGAQAAQTYLQLFNNAAPTPGVTAPDLVVPIGTVTTQGLKRDVKYILPNGGFRFATACTAFNSTTPNGGTAPTTTAIVDAIRITFQVGN